MFYRHFFKNSTDLELDSEKVHSFRGALHLARSCILRKLGHDRVTLEQLQ